MFNATCANRAHDEKKEKLLRMVEASNEPLGLPDISKTLGLSWWSTFRLVVDPILEEVQRHPEWMHHFPYMLVKTRYSIAIIPKKLLKGERSVEQGEKMGRD